MILEYNFVMKLRERTYLNDRFFFYYQEGEDAHGRDDRSM